jgi:hypothetical protein
MREYLWLGFAELVNAAEGVNGGEGEENGVSRNRRK